MRKALFINKNFSTLILSTRLHEVVKIALAKTNLSNVQGLLKCIRIICAGILEETKRLNKITYTQCLLSNFAKRTY